MLWMLLHMDFDEIKLRIGKSGRREREGVLGKLIMRGDCQFLKSNRLVQYIDEMENINLESLFGEKVGPEMSLDIVMILMTVIPGRWLLSAQRDQQSRLCLQPSTVLGRQSSRSALSPSSTLRMPATAKFSSINLQ